MEKRKYIRASYVSPSLRLKFWKVTDKFVLQIIWQHRFSPTTLHSLQAQAVWLASTLAGPLLAGGATFTSVAPRQGEIGGGLFGTAAVQTGATELRQPAVQGGAARLQGPLMLDSNENLEIRWFAEREIQLITKEYNQGAGQGGAACRKRAPQAWEKLYKLYKLYKLSKTVKKN